jgi:hypothetical protein
MLAMANRLDEHTTQLRKSVMDSIGAMRLRLHQQASDVIEHERDISREQERRLLEQIENLQKLVDLRTQQLNHAQLLNERMVGLHQQQRARWRTQALAKEALQKWRDNVQKKKYRETLREHLSNTFRKQHLKQVFTDWRIQALSQKYQEKIDKLDGGHRRQMASVLNEHQTTVNQMKLEMLAMKEQLQQEEERRGILEERLKAAFMRGVCALNMEAMQVLKNQGDDVSVASLLQGLNFTGSSDSVNVEQGTNADRLLQQQRALQEQLMRATGGAVDDEALETRAPPPQPTAQHRPVTITVNPQYRSTVVPADQGARSLRPASANQATKRWKA